MKIQLSQMELVTAIIGLCEKQAKERGVKSLPVMPHQLNAIVDAATSIVKAFAEDDRPSKPAMGVRQWINSHDTGSSSKVMCRKLTGVTPPNMDGFDDAHPLDPDDFGRCHRFLEAVHGTREQISKMAMVSPTWAKLVENWEELTALYLEEFPTGRAPKLYERMKELGC